MKKVLKVIAGCSMFFLVACGGGGEEVSDASDIYQANCLQCHGGNLEGSNGPAIDDHSKEEVLAMIDNGGNGMPANIIEGGEAEKVAEWISEQ
ncbi:cytochrome c [Salibacterium salarium]|uniref:Cytochrome c n=1 Tax=Salibacterium salarium TaxID=284579 RepID=A0A428N4U9_9BACI|nr:cytochrome c [Salibacterium salarium]RSL33514.1 cytochrome c [Salibacterium salarium]